MGDDLVERQQGTMPGSPTLMAYLVCYVPSPLFPAHWSLWIPYDSRESTIGTRIHVTGDALNGFKHEFDRRHDPATDDRRPRLIELGLIDSSHISPVGPVSNSEESHDHVIPRAYNELEQLALKIPAPGPSLRSSASNAVCCRPRERHDW
jgi:hypothetical protein